MHKWIKWIKYIIPAGITDMDVHNIYVYTCIYAHVIRTYISPNSGIIIIINVLSQFIIFEVYTQNLRMVSGLFQVN